MDGGPSNACATGETPTLSRMGKRMKLAPNTQGLGALQGLSYHSRQAKLAALCRQYPKQAAYLRYAASTGLGEAAIRAGIQKLAHATGTTADWAQFLTKLAIEGAPLQPPMPSLKPPVPPPHGVGVPPVGAPAKPGFWSLMGQSVRNPLAMGQRAIGNAVGMQFPKTDPQMSKPLVNFSNPNKPAPGVVNPGMTPEQTSAMVRSGKLNNPTFDKSRWNFNQTTAKVRSGMQLEDAVAQGGASTNHARALNPMSPVNDRTTGGAAFRTADQLPRFGAAAVAGGPAFMMDAFRDENKGQNIRGIGRDLWGPIEAGTGYTPFEHSPSFYGGLMPQYRRALQDASVNPANSQVTQGAAGLGARLTHLVEPTAAFLAGGAAGGGVQAGLATRAGSAALRNSGKVLPGIMGTAGMTVAPLAGMANRTPPTMPDATFAHKSVQDVPEVEGGLPAPAVVAPTSPEAAPTAQAAPGAVQAAQAPATPLPPLQSLDKASLDKMTAPEAAQRGAEADAKFKTLAADTAQMSPEQAKAHTDDLLKNKLAHWSKTTGEDPVAMYKQVMEDGQVSPEELKRLEVNAPGSGLMDQAQKMGTDLLSTFQSLPSAQKVGLVFGIPLAVMGIISSLFGEGGFGAMLVSLLGLAGGAHGLGMFSGKGPLGEFGQSLGLSDMFGAQQAPAKPPATTADPAGAAAPVADTSLIGKLQSGTQQYDEALQWDVKHPWLAQLGLAHSPEAERRLAESAKGYGMTPERLKQHMALERKPQAPQTTPAVQAQRAPARAVPEQSAWTRSLPPGINPYAAPNEPWWSRQRPPA